MKLAPARVAWRPGSVLVAFALFAAYGLLRWQTMLAQSERSRLAALLGLSLLVAVGAVWWDLPGRHWALMRRRPVRVALGACALAIVLGAMVAVAGLPLSWTLNLRIALIARALGDGIRALPALDVPYHGHSRSALAVIVLGAGLLMLAAALVLGPAGGAKQRAGVWRWLAFSAGLLLVLVILPSVLGAPRFGALHGVITFALLVLFMCGWQRRSRLALGAVLLIAVAGAGGVLIGQLINPRHGLVNASKLVTSLGPEPPAIFNWEQKYGPLGGEQSRTVVLRVQARHAAYWKAEDLDVFDGTGWVTNRGPVLKDVYGRSTLVGVSQASARRWTQTLKFSDVAMRSRQVITAGIARPPKFANSQQVPLPGTDTGSWVLLAAMSPGTHYRVRVYTPRPTATELQGTRARYPSILRRSELKISLPARKGHGPVRAIDFAPYGTTQRITVGPELVQRFHPVHQPATGVVIPPEAVTGQVIRFVAVHGLAVKRAELRSSALWPVYLLARRLARGTRTPFAYVSAVDRYLHHGFTYTRNPPRVAQPIVSFLLHTKRGYCQQFAGAMALLLRMGGVPARVAVGFTAGSYDRQQHAYTVTAGEAHAWVEAWFPGYGWITFDPTPAARDVATSAAGTNSGASSLLSKALASGGAANQPQSSHATHETRTTNHVSVKHAGGGVRTGVALLLVACGLLALLLCVSALVAARRLLATRRSFGSTPAERLLAELQAAFVRCGYPLREGVTLAQLERFLGERDAAAASYVRDLRLTRFSPTPTLPTALQRRALRAWLRHGRGLRGRLAAYLALPPSSLH